MSLYNQQFINWQQMSTKPILGNILIWICLISIATAQKQIDTFNILLPQLHSQTSGRPIELVTASGGCLEWASSSPQTVSVEGLSKGVQKCHNRGLVSLKHVGPYQGSIYVTATNIETSELSNVNVRIRPVQKIEIIAKARLMNRNEMQDLKIFAYDKEHNMFTSLQGLKFEWTLIEGVNVLSKISLKNSHLSLPLDQRKEIEKRGAQSDILVVKGDQPGKAVVRVKCIQPGYEHLRHEITISVQQRFDLTPSHITYLITSSSFNFGLISPSRELLAIPKPYYKATMSSPLFTVTNNLQVIAPLTESQTVLKVQDTRTVPAYSSEVVIYSKQPTSIVLKVDEYVIVGEEARVDVELYWNKQLLKGQTKNYKIVTDLAYDMTKGTIQAKQRTTAAVKATYKSLTTEKKVHIVLPLKAVLPSTKITLPVGQTFQLKIIGGSGIYEYHLQQDIATISGSGVISTKKQGVSRVTVTDKRVLRNKVVLELVVSTVGSLVPLQSQKELNVNEFGLVFTMARGKNYEQYTKCSEQPIVLTIEHLPHFQSTNNVSFVTGLQTLTTKMSQSPIVKSTIMKHALLPLGVEDFMTKFSTYIRAGDISSQQLRKYSSQLQNYGICSIHSIKSSQKFDTQLNLYHRQNVNVKNKFNLRVYDRIANSLQKECGDYFIMTPLSTLQWKTIGGSYAWQGRTKTLLNSVQYQTDYPVVKCPERQTVLEMKLQRANVQTSQLILPVTQSKLIYVHCKYPSQLKLKFEKQSLDATTINGLKGQTINGQLIPLDNKGETFYNSSNLVYEVEKTAGVVKINHEKFQFDPQNAASARVTFWTQSIHGLKSTFSKVSTAFIYNSKPMFTLTPHPDNNYLIILFNPKATYNFKLQSISDNSQVQCEGSISCFYKNKEIHLNTTRLGSGSMRIVDKSLYDYPTLLIRFDVVDADEIVLQMEKQTVQVEKKLSAEVKLYYHKQLIPVWQYDTKNLMLVHEGGLRSKEIQSTERSNNYQISADKPGSYRIIAEQHYPRYLQSAPILLTVYPKFETNIPSLQHSYTKEGILELKGELTVAVDCMRKVHLMGGPQAITVKHEVKNKHLIEIKQDTREPRQISILGLHQGKTTVIFIISSGLDHKISIIHLQIIIKPIDHATIYSLNEALVSAQFRIIPHLIVDGKVLLDSVCQFEYKWTSDTGRIRLSGIDSKRGLGVNATAIKQGDAFVTVQILRNQKTVFVTTKQITVHKSLDMALPTVIGKDQSLTATSSNILIPPNSGYQLQDQSLTIHKLSESTPNLLTINQNNRLVTGRQKGVVSVKAQKSTDLQYNNYLNIIVTDIKALFIENSYSVVSADVGKVTDVRFYVLDMYGRMFYNNLFNVEYDILSSNEDIFTVSMDNTKSFIRIHPQRQGEAQLILKLKSTDGQDSLAKLAEIPHDIVNVQIGKVIEPQSPIYLAVGGEVSLQYHGKSSDKLEMITGGKLVSIDQQTKKITALQAGQATLSITGHQITVRILDVILKQRTITEPTPGLATLVTEYVATGKWMDEVIYFQSISNSFNYVNNNLNLTCLPVNRRYFATKSEVIKTEHFDKLKCDTVMNFDFDAHETMPNELELKVVQFDKNGAKSYLHTTKKPILATFWVPRVSKVVLLSPEKPTADIFIKTPHKLHIELIGGEKSWIHEQFEAGPATHGIRLTVDPKQLNKNIDFKLKLTHPQTTQTQQITVKYIIDEAARKAQQQAEAASSKSTGQQKQQFQTVTKSTAAEGMFDGWHWTDFIILIMGVNFILILLYQALVNGGDKYKTL